jgi:hypothetical protein
VDPPVRNGISASSSREQYLSKRPIRRALFDFIDRSRCTTLAAIEMQQVMACGILLGIAVPVVVLFVAVLATS